MNKERRDMITKVSDALEDLKAKLEPVRDDEQDAFDNVPENMQSGEKGEKMEADIQSLSDAIDSIEEAISRLGEIE